MEREQLFHRICNGLTGEVTDVPFTPEEMDEAYARAEAAAKVQWYYDRQNNYPPIPDQLDTIFHQGIEAWKAQIQAVKDQYPKPPTE